MIVTQQEAIEKERRGGAKAAEPNAVRQPAKRTAESGVLALQQAAGNRVVEGLLNSGAVSDGADPSGVLPIVSEVLRSGRGQPLDPDAREFMESRFDTDFSQVRVHTGSHASESAAEMNARAYTVGRDIAFRGSEYAPETPAGRQLLAHELAHVIQQRRGGSPPAAGDTAELEQHANQAANAVVLATDTVTVSGSAAPSIMCETDDEEFDREEGHRKAQQRLRQKEKTQGREEQRSRAGKSEGQIAHERAEQELQRLEKEAQSMDAKRWSPKTKEQKLTHFEEVLKDADMPLLDKNMRKGAYDEALRTPNAGRTAGNPQTKYVAGHEELPFMELRPGEDSYAQPDYSVYRRKPDGTVERVHVNLKSNKLHAQTVSQARATARYNTDQAIRNAHKLPQGESIIVSYARTPSKEVQEAILAEHFRQDVPISEVRFGSTTYKRSEFKGPPASLGLPLESSLKGISGQPGNEAADTAQAPPELQTPTPALIPKRKGLPPKKLGSIFKKEGEAETRRFQKEQERLLKPPSPATPEEITKMRKAIERGDVQPVDQEVGAPSSSRTGIRVREGGSTVAQPTPEPGSTSAEAVAAEAEVTPLKATPETVLVGGEQIGIKRQPLPVINPAAGSALREGAPLPANPQTAGRVNERGGPKASHASLEPHEGAAAGAAAGAGQLLIEIEEALQREAAYRDSRRAGSLRTLQWWLQRGVQPSVRGVQDRWFRLKDDYTPGVPETLRGAQEGKFEGIEIDRLNDPEQYEAFETWAKANVQTWADFYRHFIRNEDAGVRWNGSGWELATWKWGDWPPANVAKKYVEDARISTLMEPIRQRVFAQTQKEIEDRAKKPDALGQGGEASIVGVRRFKKGHGTLYSPVTKTPVKSWNQWEFEPVFYEVAGAPAPNGYVFVSGADFRTYAEIYGMRAYYDHDFAPATIESSESRQYSEVRPFTGWGSINIPVILVEKDALIDQSE